ncbi:pilin [Stenotrophomonas sp. ZAC14A_NAIMI4_1]|uniref:pilin n=1 Tax=Stenotrophomonas sp. ZAC14A_NAIMI4_1 TaxID=2072412 RepID=UPI000D53F41A|nr:pilin [Stenotrophomonas sp. ZAC14A_NAIMI4_1]AWH43987.1 prepilin-type cleavage/methylation domain-containing protein [Stenotrophomonas sp. ZAC14A_NAIMI4_1]
MTTKHEARSTSPVPSQHGFSLIELMVVVAIIAILGMIALPQYQKFATRAKYSAALAEIAPGKAGVEVLFAEGEPGRTIQPSNIGLELSTSNCERITTELDDFNYPTRVEIICELAWSLSPDTISLVREHTGEWRCTSNIYNKSLLPEVCRA